MTLPTQQGPAVVPGRGHGAHLGLVFVQYDRRRYSGALLRLLGSLAALRARRIEVAIVDNGQAGDWAHEVADGVFHLGGDNTAWEFSAFDKGLRFLGGGGRRIDAWILATDALLAYGDDYLRLLDQAALDWCLTSGSCVGWIDSFYEDSVVCGLEYRCWLRSSLLVLPPHAAEHLNPLAYPLDDQALFGDCAEQPFAAHAAISDNLRGRLLEWLTDDGGGAASPELPDTWHSRFALRADTFDLFKAKVRAILREHLVSARLQRAGIAGYELRAIRLARTERVAPPIDWQWLRGRDLGAARVPC